MNSISAEELKKILKTKPILLIDIREHYIYERGTIATAINIPFRILKQRPEQYLTKDKLYYIFCESGTISLRLANYLRQLGYQVISVNGGYEAFKKL